jgi:hypothetical protein
LAGGGCQDFTNHISDVKGHFPDLCHLFRRDLRTEARPVCLYGSELIVQFSEFIEELATTSKNFQ